MLLGGMYLLFWNEGRAIKRLRVLDEGKASLVTLSSDQTILPENDGKLVYSSTLATSKDHLYDKMFDVGFDGIALNRRVEMYQWLETKTTNTKEDSHGNEVTTTTCSYDKGWSSSPQNSSAFAKPAKHQNPGMPFRSEEFLSGNVYVGVLKLSRSMVAKIENHETMFLEEKNIPEHLNPLSWDVSYVFKELSVIHFLMFSPEW